MLKLYEELLQIGITPDVVLYKTIIRRIMEKVRRFHFNSYPVENWRKASPEIPLRSSKVEA